MTEEEKDILQDKVLREEANYFETNQHDELVSSDSDYRESFYLKEGISRALAKEFIEKALETPVIRIGGDEEDGAETAAYVPAASHSPSSKNNMGWYAIAATLVIVLASTFFLSDFRTANEFAQAEIDNIPKSSEVLFGSAPVARGGFDWRRAFNEGDYNSVIQNLDSSDKETRLALGISKLLCLNECEKDSDDFGQNELGWILKNDLPEGVSRSQVLWYNSLALSLSGECDEAIKSLNEITTEDSDLRKKVRKLKKKLNKDCDDKHLMKEPTDKVWGIDISHHQRNVQWNKMPDKKPDFIFLKATEGSTHTDTRYKKYKAEAEKLDIPTGAYHFFSYTSDGAKQARHFIATAKLKSGNLLPVLDCEFRRNMPNSHKVTRELMKFIRTIESELGVSPIIYCECSYYNKYLKNEVKGRCPLWISNFHREPACNYVFWQKTDKFRHPSFAGTVDYNSFKGGTQELKKYQLK